MGVVWRFLAFVIGASAGIFGLGLTDHFLPGFWVPATLAVVVSIVIYNHAWLRKLGLAGPISAALGAGVCAGWLASSNLTIHTIDLEYLPAVMLEVVCTAAFVVVLVRTWRLPEKQRPAGWSLVMLILMGWAVSLGSSSAGGANHTLEILQKLGFSTHDATVLVPYIRKTIHFTFYGTLGWFGMRSALQAKEKRAAAVRFGLLMTLAMASFDESRQIFVEGRGASFWDVMLDMSGAATFILLSWLRASRPKSKS